MNAIVMMIRLILIFCLTSLFGQHLGHLVAAVFDRVTEALR